MAAIEVHGLRKVYGDVTAVDGIDLTVEEGEVVALLGPNGAGKSTALRLLAGLLPLDDGMVRLGRTVVETMPTSHKYWRSGKLPAMLQRSCQEAQEWFTRAYRSAAQPFTEPIATAWWSS